MKDFRYLLKKIVIATKNLNVFSNPKQTSSSLDTIKDFRPITFKKLIFKNIINWIAHVKDVPRIVEVVMWISKNLRICTYEKHQN